MTHARDSGAPTPERSPVHEIACSLYIFLQLIHSPFRRIIHNLLSQLKIKKKGNRERAQIEPSATRGPRLVPDARTWHGAHQPLRPRCEFPRHRRLLAAAGWRWHPELLAAVEERHLAAFLVDRQQPAALAWRAVGGQKQAQGKDRRPRCPH
jgi:hypothetical protein